LSSLTPIYINRHCVPLFTKNTLLSSLTPILFSEQVILAEALSQNSWCLETIKENQDKIERNAHLSSLTPILFSEQVILAEALSQNSWCLETIKENQDKIERNAHLSSLTPIFFCSFFHFESKHTL